MKQKTSRIDLFDLNPIYVNHMSSDNVVHVNGVTFKMIKVSGGTFNDTTLTTYYIGETEVTQELWLAVMGSNPSYFKGNLQRPVEMVSWNDIKGTNGFIEKLNTALSSKLGGKKFDLPTEAQWEFAARGGNNSHGYDYAGSDNIDDVAWYGVNSGGQTHTVGQKQPNELGLYDMSGNVWEWCKDWYGSYGSGSQTDPTGPSTGSFRVLRGGSWRLDARYHWVSFRLFDYPDSRYYSLGFRLVLLP